MIACVSGPTSRPISWPRFLLLLLIQYFHYVYKQYKTPTRLGLHTLSVVIPANNAEILNSDYFDNPPRCIPKGIKAITDAEEWHARFLVYFIPPLC